MNWRENHQKQSHDHTSKHQQSSAHRHRAVLVRFGQRQRHRIAYRRTARIRSALSTNNAPANLRRSKSTATKATCAHTAQTAVRRWPVRASNECQTKSTGCRRGRRWWYRWLWMTRTSRTKWASGRSLRRWTTTRCHSTNARRHHHLNKR